MDCLEMTRAEMQHDLEVFERFAWGLVVFVVGLCGILGTGALFNILMRGF
jgi:hypothetical protein